MPAHRGPWRDLDTKVSRAVEDGMNEPWRVDEPRPFTFNSVIGLARSVATAAPEKRAGVTRWAARCMAENVASRNISRDLAHRVLFEAAMRNGLAAAEAGSIIENAFRSGCRG
jgi:hypothetical protein